MVWDKKKKGYEWIRRMGGMEMGKRDIFVKAENGIRDLVRNRGIGDGYKRQRVGEERVGEERVGEGRRGEGRRGEGRRGSDIRI